MANHKLTIAAVFGLGMIVGCGGGGGGDFGSLYDPPAGNPTASLYGRWGGEFLGNETRWVLGADEITLANKCGTKVVGVVVAARVSDTEITVLESGNDGGEDCFVNAMPGGFAVCSTDPFMPHDNCFVHAGTDLTLYESDVNYLDLTKLED